VSSNAAEIRAQLVAQLLAMVRDQTGDPQAQVSEPQG